MSTLLILAAHLLIGLMAITVFARMAAGWFGAARATFGRALAATGTLLALGSIILAANIWLWPNLPQYGIILVAIGQALVSILIVGAIFGLPVVRAAATWLVGIVLLPVIFVLATAFLIVRPFLVEAFVVPTNSMAPTVLGWHTSGICPRCGGAMFVPAPEPGSPATGFGPWQSDGICGQCGEIGQPLGVSATLEPPDRIMINKLLPRRRWDLIVFRYPMDPSQKYVKRLVGLPGEVVFIKDGAIWVNGAKLDPPESARHIQYKTSPDYPGSPDQPWELKAGECVVLSDFPQTGSDSRYWGPVSEATIEGVVSVRYWPLARWHVWR
jgi:signal peptidase I